jgi:hemerythrin-like domain-containing protein
MSQQARQTAIPEEARQTGRQTGRQTAIPEEARQTGRQTAIPEEARQTGRQTAIPEEARHPTIPEQARETKHPTTAEEGREEREARQARQGREEKNDGIQLVSEEHCCFKKKIDKFREKGQSFTNQVDTLRCLIREISRLASAEERHLFPLIKTELKTRVDPNMLYTRSILDDQINKELMLWLEDNMPSNPEEASEEAIKIFRRTAEKFFHCELEHIEVEEQWVLEPLKQNLTDGQKQKLYEDLCWAKEHAPSHPHPGAPAGGMWSKVIDPVSGVTDKVSESVGYKK